VCDGRRRTIAEVVCDTDQMLIEAVQIQNRIARRIVRSSRVAAQIPIGVSGHAVGGAHLSRAAANLYPAITAATALPHVAAAMDEAVAGAARNTFRKDHTAGGTSNV